MDYLAINNFELSFKLLKSTEKLLNIDDSHEHTQISLTI